MQPVDVREARAVLAQMTPGEWRAYNKNGYAAVMLGDSKVEVVAWTGFDASDVPKDKHTNATGIVYLKNHAGVLLDALEKAEAENATLRVLLGKVATEAHMAQITTGFTDATWREVQRYAPR